MEILGFLLATLAAVLIVQRMDRPRDSYSAAEKRHMRFSDEASVVVPFRLEDSRSCESAAEAISMEWIRMRKVYVRFTLDSRRPLLLGWWDDRLLGSFLDFMRAAWDYGEESGDGRLVYIGRSNDGSEIRLTIWRPDLEIIRLATSQFSV